MKYLIAILFLSLVLAKEYGPMTYQEIYDQWQEMAHNYPHLVKLEDASKKFNLPSYSSNMCGNKLCEILIATITADKSGSAPQVYLSGALHGDERVGPVAVTQFIDYLLSNYETDPEVRQLLNEREILVTPMTNADGYF